MEKKEVFKITYIPAKFDVSPIERLSEFGVPLKEFYISDSEAADLYPEIIVDTTAFRGEELIFVPHVQVNLPNKIIIEVEKEDLNKFYWADVIIPVINDVSFTKENVKTGLYMNFYDVEGKKTLKTIAVDVAAWENLENDELTIDNPDSPYQKPVTGHGFGRAEHWNMTYFTPLPKCSMVYDFWITARGMDTEKRRFEIDFFVDGEKITQSNFEEMAIKYPALKNTDPKWQIMQPIEIKTE